MSGCSAYTSDKQQQTTTSTTTADENVAPSKMNTPSQIALDAARWCGKDPLDLCDVCGEDRGDHDTYARGALVPCESDGK